MSDDPWGRMAAWRDARMGEAGDLWHRAIIDPELRAVIGPVNGLRVLDLACGNGYLARRFAAEGARRVVGIDASRATLARAVARERADPRGVRFEVADGPIWSATRAGRSISWSRTWRSWTSRMPRARSARSPGCSLRRDGSSSR